MQKMVRVKIDPGDRLCR